jgi:cysteine synthase B
VTAASRSAPGAALERAVITPPTPPSAGPLAVPSVLQLVGNTPMVEIRHVRDGTAPGVRILAKLEGFNPGGSVKDRPALKMVEDGLARGALVPGKTIIDSTSGNTGIALAMVGAALGFPVELVMPSNVSMERKRVVAAFGARTIFSDPLEGSDGAIRLCRKILAEHPDRYFKPDQYNNPANPLAHYQTTGPEIWRQTDGKITHLFVSLGTCGTAMGAGRFLKEQNPAVKLIAVQPSEGHDVPGLRNLSELSVSHLFDRSLVDELLEVDFELAYTRALDLARQEGLLAGPSSGLILEGARLVSQREQTGFGVMIFPDNVFKYVSSLVRHVPELAEGTTP